MKIASLYRTDEYIKSLQRAVLMLEFMNRYRAPIVTVCALVTVLALVSVFVLYPSYTKSEFEKKFTHDTEILCRSAWQLDVHIPKQECRESALLAKALIDLRDTDNKKYAECLAYVAAGLKGTKKAEQSCSVKAINELTIEHFKILHKRIEIYDSIKLG